METHRFDFLAKTLATPGTRRGLGRLLTAFPVAGRLITLLAPEAVQGGKAKDGKGRGKNGKGTAGSNTVICIPTTCATRGKTCGTIRDGCGGTLHCGDCPAGQTCLSNGSCATPCAETCTTNTECCSKACTCGSNPEAGHCQVPFRQDFSSNAAGWNGVTASGGEGQAGSGEFTAFTRWGGYSNVFPADGSTTTLDIYLDLDSGAGNDTRFDWTSAVGTPDCSHRRDFVFNVGYYDDGGTCPGSGQRFVISASNNAGRGGADPCNPGRDPIVINASGWYTFTHQFMNDGGVLVVALATSGPGGGGDWTLSDSSDMIGDTVGGNRYGAFATQEFPVLAIDNSARM